MLLNHTFFINKNLYKNSFFFDFFFVSFFAPNFLKNFTSFFNIKYFNTKKIHLKQSYLLFSWFYYLTIVTKKNGKKLNFFVFPKKKFIETYTRAPIAHKTWSKEQYLFKFYLLKISYKTNFTDDRIKTVESGLVTTIFSHKYFPIFETNILFLKYFKFIFTLYDKKYLLY